MSRRLAYLRLPVIFLAGCLALSAIPGGFTLLAGVYTPPVKLLEGTVFPTYFIPGLALLVVVGGTSLLAFVLLLRRNRLGPAVAGFAGAFVMVFEFVEVLAIGAPPGPAFVMQALYFGIGLALVCLSLLLLFFANDASLTPTSP